jgi:hypothetical protein
MASDYQQGPVPTVFVESPPPPPPAPPKEDKGGIVISRGFLGVLIVLLLGAAIAGTGFYYLQYQGALETVAKRDETIEGQKKTLGERDKAIADSTRTISDQKKVLDAFNLQYGQIEQFKKDGSALQAKIDEVLARRPGTRGIPDRLKATPAWREGAEASLAAWVAALQKEFDRIDRPVATGAVDVLPSKPVIVPSGN